LIGGKPVPHVGWVFVERLPVRGPKSRQAVKDAKQTTRPTSSRAARGTGSTLAEQPMPVPTAPPPGLALTTKAKRQPAAAAAVLAAAPGGNGVPQAGRTTVNDLLPFLEFVERHPVGTGCTVVVESYASHGAYARAGDVLVYVPLRLMGDPPPRSARAARQIGEAVAVVIVGYVPERRSIDAALASAGEAVKAQVAAPETPAVAEMPATKRRSRSKQAAEAPADLEPAVAAEPVAETPSKRRRAAKKATADVVVATPTEQPALPLEPVATPDEVEVKPARRTRRKAAAAPPAAPEPTVEPKPTRKRAAKPKPEQPGA
jgi:hypothetical protein